MTTTRAVFTLPECNEAFARWQEITGLDATSPEWGEVRQVLHHAGLLAADRDLDPVLFEMPTSERARHADAVFRLRLCLLAGARYVEQEAEAALDVATATAVVAALLDDFYDRGFWAEFNRWVTRLSAEVPRRVVTVVHNPADALNHLVDRAGGMPEGLATLHQVVWQAAMGSDQVARTVFAVLEGSREHRLKLVPLCTGQWLLYRNNV